MKQPVLITLIAVSLLVSACGAGGAATTATPEAIPTVIADSTIIAEGRLQPVRDAEIAFTASGVVSNILVQEGEPVKQGQPSSAWAMPRIPSTPPPNSNSSVHRKLSTTCSMPPAKTSLKPSSTSNKPGKTSTKPMTICIISRTPRKCRAPKSARTWSRPGRAMNIAPRPSSTKVPRPKTGSSKPRTISTSRKPDWMKPSTPLTA